LLFNLIPTPCPNGHLAFRVHIYQEESVIKRGMTYD